MGRTIRLTRLRGLPVVDWRVAHQAGVLEDMLLDLAQGRLACLSVHYGEGWLVQRVSAAQIHRLGPQVIVIAGAANLAFEGPRISDPSWIELGRLLGLHVYTEGGDCLGRVADVHVDAETLSLAYLSLGDQPSGIPLRRRDRVQVSEVVSYSNQLVVVRDPSRAARDMPATVDRGSTGRP